MKIKEKNAEAEQKSQASTVFYVRENLLYRFKNFLHVGEEHSEIIHNRLECENADCVKQECNSRDNRGDRNTENSRANEGASIIPHVSVFTADCLNEPDDPANNGNRPEKLISNVAPGADRLEAVTVIVIFHFYLPFDQKFVLYILPHVI